MLSKAEFFKQATCHLLQTLNLQKGVERLQLYVSSVLPCGEIRMSCFPSCSTAPSKNLHIRADGREASTYYGAPLTTERMEVLLSLTPLRGELITDPAHPLVSFCRSLNASGHGLMPLPWYDLVLRDDDGVIGECRFSGFADKPFTPRQRELLDSLRPVLCIALSNYRKYLELQAAHTSVKRENTSLKMALTGGSGNTELVGAQGGLRQVLERVRLVAGYEIPVLITGETGTGKELIARMVHSLSPRREGPFIALNCGAIPSSLIDSELFGYMKGAFTGAARNYKGYFERAAGGTLFLDEVGELPLDAQVRLLRVLQEREIQPLGASGSVSIDARILAATNRDLREMVRAGTFRSDLYYRLRGAHILLPPLRERPGDIPDLVRHILHESAESMGLPLPVPDRGELARLQRYCWPGNIRELQNVLVEAMVSTPPGVSLRFNLDMEAGAVPDAACHTERNGGISLTSDAVLARHYAEVLESCHGRIKGDKGAAAILGINPSTLRFRLKKLGLLDPKNGHDR